MSNDPLLGLDFQPPEPEKTKWTERPPKKLSGGFAVRTRAGAFGDEEEWQPGVWVSPAPDLSSKVAPEIEDYVHDNLGASPPAPPAAYAIPKPSWFQRLLDWLLL